LTVDVLSGDVTDCRRHPQHRLFTRFLKSAIPRLDRWIHHTSHSTTWSVNPSHQSFHDLIGESSCWFFPDLPVKPEGDARWVPEGGW